MRNRGIKRFYPNGLATARYDAESQIKTAAGVTYAYDGNGQRVEKVGGGNTIVTIFAGSQVLDEYYNGAAPSSPTNEYVYAGGLRLAIIQSGSTYYWHNDHLSPRVRTDSSGNIADQRGTFPSGETWYSPGSTAPWMFTTYYRDVEAEGNDYAQARTYISGLGRFASPDPVAGSTSDPQSLNRYSYVRNMPALLTDPFGLTPFCATVRNHGAGADTETSGGGPSADSNDVEADPPQNGCGEIDCNFTIEGCPPDDGFGGGGGGIWGTESGFGDLGPWGSGPLWAGDGDYGFGDGGILAWLAGGGGGDGGFGSSGNPFGIPFGPPNPCAMDADGSLAAMGVCGGPCFISGMPGLCVNSGATGGGGGASGGSQTTLRPRTQQEYNSCMQNAVAMRSSAILSARGEQLVGGLLTLTGVGTAAYSLPALGEGFFNEGLSGLLHFFHAGGFAYFGALGPLGVGLVAFGRGTYGVANAWNQY